MGITWRCLRSLNADFPLLFCTFLLLQPLFAHPFSFDISSFTAGENNILYEGDATVSSGSMELVTDSKLGCRIGHGSYADGVRIWDSSTGKLADFTTHFSFTILNYNNSIFCDGFTFYFSPLVYPIPPNSAGGYLGLFNTTMMASKVVLVEFDTYVNAEWDPPTPHVGINIGSLASEASQGWDISLISGMEANAWISYNSTTQNLSVFWTYEKDPVYTGNSTFSYIVDLATALPESVRIGFSASTAMYFCHSTIHSWQFNSTLDSTAMIGSENRFTKKSQIVVGLGGFAFFLVLASGIGYFLVRRRRIRSRSSNVHEISMASDGLLKDDLERGGLPRRFYYQELETATNSFSDRRRLGQGASGHVYKGMLHDIDRLVAVKRICDGFGNSEQIFMNEVKIISRLIHRNLVQFIGWCHEKGKFLLVYDYMSNGSLDTHLYGNRRTLPWQVRYKIATDLASAIRYLHEEAEVSVLHRDIKSANVLLDTYYCAKLGDFGVAKLVDPRLRTQMTGLVGTCGYWAPEYYSEGRVSKESDMFSFGIVALEIACGRRTYQDGEIHLPLAKWVWQLYLEGKILDAADERLNSDYDRSEMECLLKVGLWCAHPKDKQRLKAGQVIKILQREIPLPELPDDAHNLTFPAAPPQLDSTTSLMSSSNESAA